MIRRSLIAAALLSVIPVASAQQATDPAFLGQTVSALQQQRNSALDFAAQLQAQSAMQAAEIAKLKARIAELEKAPAADPGK
jgi:cell division protein FtsB